MIRINYLRVKELKLVLSKYFYLLVINYHSLISKLSLSIIYSKNNEKVDGWKEISKIIFSSNPKFKTYIKNFKLGVDNNYGLIFPTNYLGKKMKNLPMYSVTVENSPIKSPVNRIPRKGNSYTSLSIKQS